MIPSLPFRTDAPDREEAVLDQWSGYYPYQWLQRLPDPSLWPEPLPLAPADGERRPTVDRRAVLEIGAALHDPASAVHAYVASAVWGTGTNAQGVARRCAIFTGSADDVGQRLLSVAQVMLDHGPDEAYAELHGDRRVKYLGPAFGTKFLYFCGFDRAPGRRQPLILDSYVASALNQLCGLSLPLSNFSPEVYAFYLDLAHRWADEWGTSPDVVERVLFAAGRSDPVAISALNVAAPRRSTSDR
jgi:hypothetical protein